MAILIFPDNPVDGQLYPPQQLPGVNQYRWSASSNSWVIQSGAGGSSITVSTAVTTVTNTVVPAVVPEVDPNENIEFEGSEDEGHIEVDIGFPVQILGNTYTSVLINANSYFSFGDTTDSYGETSYTDWIIAVPYPGVFIGTDDGSVQKITSSGPLGTVGQRTNTIRFQGSVDFANSNPNLSDVFWEITFKEDEPSKVFLNILAFNSRGGTEGVDFFSFSSLGVNGEVNSYESFDPTAGNQYEITLDTSTAYQNFTGSKLVLLDEGVQVSENIAQNSVDVEFGLANYVKSDTSIDPSFNKISNIVSLTQLAYDSLVTVDPETLYVIVG